MNLSYVSPQSMISTIPIKTWKKEEKRVIGEEQRREGKEGNKRERKRKKEKICYKVAPYHHVIEMHLL